MVSEIADVEAVINRSPAQVCGIDTQTVSQSHYVREANSLPYKTWGITLQKAESRSLIGFLLSFHSIFYIAAHFALTHVTAFIYFSFAFSTPSMACLKSATVFSLHSFSVG